MSSSIQALLCIPHSEDNNNRRQQHQPSLSLHKKSLRGRELSRDRKSTSPPRLLICPTKEQKAAEKQHHQHQQPPRVVRIIARPRPPPLHIQIAQQHSQETHQHHQKKVVRGQQIAPQHQMHHQVVCPQCKAVNADNRKNISVTAAMERTTTTSHPPSAPPQIPTKETLGERIYGRLGPPQKQPRLLKFIPRCGKIGQGTAKTKEKEVEDRDLKISNSDLIGMAKVTEVKAGDVILASRPFVHVLSTGCRRTRCEGCYQTKPAKVVCQCQYAYYCSESCKETDKENHGDECFYIKRKKSPPTSDTVRFLLRLILKMRRGGDAEAELVPGLERPRRFKDLVDHYDDILTSNRKDAANAYYEEILRFLGMEDAPDPDFFLECYGRMAVNSFHILDENHEGIGTALYLGPSVMDHSCQPNAAVNFDGRNIVVRSLIDRPTVDFNEVRGKFMWYTTFRN